MPDSTDLTDRVVGTYRIISRVGAGGMGEVYLAHDDKLDRRVAIKVLGAALANDSDRLRRFQQEARAASSLNHPHIVVVHDFGEVDGRPFIVTELVEGETLRDRLRRGPLPPGDAVEIASQVLSALTATHAHGLVHRDIKPENVMVRPDGYVKVLDFGVAKLTRPDAISPTAATLATESGQIVGTPAYMSPEQARGEPMDARTDLFSVGAVLYEMVTGRRVFDGDTTPVVFAAILGGTPPAPSSVARQVPPDLDRVVVKALETRRELRYQTAADMRADLQRVQRALDANHPVTTARRRMPAVIAVVIAIALALLMTAWRIFSPPASVARVMLGVLPFKNLSDAAQDEYFADGLTEEMIAQLGQLEPSKLGVIARTSTMRYKHTSESAAQIGRELGAQYLLEGSVRRAADRVRIVTELVAAGDQGHLWSQTFERPLSDILRIQQEIASQVTRSLSIKLLPGDAHAIADAPLNLDSYDNYLRGLHELGAGTREGGTKAIDYFKAGIERDPNNARLQGALAEAYSETATYYSSPTEVMPLARESARRAIELDPNLASAHVTLGDVRLEFDWDWQGAEAEYRRALEINSNLPAAQLGYATYLATLGRFDEAIARVQQAYLVDPLAIQSRNDALWIYYFSGRTAETIDQAKRTIDIEPAAGLPYALLALAYSTVGRIPDALRAAGEAEQRGTSPTVLAVTAWALARAGQQNAARDLLNRALALANDRYVCRFLVADVQLELGQDESAIESLEQAYRQRST